MLADVKRDLEITLETALMLAEPGTSIRTIAERVYESEPRLVGQVQREWTIERFIWMLNRRKQSVPSERQMLLPGFPSLPRRMTLKDGRRPFLMQGTLSMLQEFRDVLMKRKGARLRTIERLIELVSGYAKDRAGITVAEVVAAENEKRRKEGEQ